jgi:hypothetical protein
MSEAQKQTPPEPISHRIVTAVAEYEGVDPVSLTPPLFDVVDPDALDALFPQDTDANSSVYCSFSYRGHLLEIHSGGVVTVTDGPAVADATSSSDSVWS